MLKLAVLSFIVAYACAAYYDESAPLWAKKVNSENGNWQAGFNPYLSGKSLQDMKSLMGTRMEGRRAGIPVVEGGNTRALPASFTSGKDKWPNCASTINWIKDQADCGSCWAVSASEVVADRTCIGNYASVSKAAAGGAMLPPIAFSAEQIMSCCTYCGDGCQGGYPIDAMRYWSYTGVVTGGPYGSNCGCQPYMIPPCGPNGCSGPEAQTPSCSNSCRSGYATAFAADHHMASSYYYVRGAAAIQNEIYNNGPVECAFEVYENFMSYKGGVYDKTGGQYLGGHAVKIIGWGTLNNVPYWLINNSWNTTWGMTGQFMFKRGTNLAGMEGECVAGKAKTSDSNFKLTC